MPEKLQIGGRFEALLKRDRDRYTRVLVEALAGVTHEVAYGTPRTEKVVCQAGFLIDRGAAAQFEATLRAAAGLFDQNYSFDYSGPWPAYSFVRLRLQRAGHPSAA